MKRNGTIELLRFLFAMMVMLFHGHYLVPKDEFVPFWRGAIGVEFFFIVSGYLMACSAYKKIQESDFLIGQETQRFIWRKIMALMPNYLIAWTMGIFVMCIRSGADVKKGIEIAVEGMWKLLFLSMAGFGDVDFTWYISAMLIALLILYPLCLKNFDVFVYIFAPVVSILILGFFFYTTRTPSQVTKYYVFLYKGLLRAGGEILLGSALFLVIERMKKVKFTICGRRLLSGIEILSWVVTFSFMALCQNASLDFYVLPFIVIGVVLSFSHQSVFADKLDNSVCYKFGEFSLSLYLAHGYWNHFVNKKYSHLGYTRKLVLYLFLSFIASLLIFFVSKYIKGKFKNRQKKLYQIG